jgi:putative aldouronate transport system substrate-binding protein
MRKIKSVVAATISGLLVAGFAACSGKSGASAKKVDTSKHVVITYMTTGNKPTNGATEAMLKKLNVILTEKANAELQIYYIPWTDYLTNYNLTLAQMDGSVDLVGTASDWLDAWKNTKTGAFLPLSEDMLKEYAPKTWASVSKEHWDMCKMNGQIYLMPEDNYSQWINHGFMYRGDWAKEAGLTTGVHSWEDLTKYFEYIRKAKPSVIPWDSDAATSTYHGEGYIESKSDYISLDGISTYYMFGVRRSNLKKLYSPFLEGNELVEYAKLMKKWDQMGVWKKDVLNNTSDNRSEFYLGQTAVDQHHTQTWYTLVRPEMQKRQPGSDVEFFWFGEESGNVTTMTITHGAMALSAASKNPERALMVYDLLRNDKECYDLFNYGIEGKQYILTKDGYRDRPEGYTEDKDGIVTDYWWGRNDDLEIRDVRGAWDKYDEITKVYNSAKIDYPYGQIVWDVDGINTELANISDVWSNYMSRICYGKMDDPVAYVAEFRSALKKAGIDRVVAELQKQLDEFNAQKK